MKHFSTHNFQDGLEEFQRRQGRIEAIIVQTLLILAIIGGFILGYLAGAN